MRHADYRVGWICALTCERAAAICMLDEQHPGLQQHPADDNNYTLGRVGSHNVVIASLPAGVTGLRSAGKVALQMQLTFVSIRFGFMVGIGGGVPSKLHDIRLGDVVVSRPGGRSGGVIQFDFGKTVAEGQFVQTGSLNRPPDILLKAESNLEAAHMLKGSKITSILATCAESYPMHVSACCRPTLEDDVLFESSYDHEDANATCQQCKVDRRVNRDPRPKSEPKIHYGLIASGNQVMRDGNMRENLRQKLDVLCFEMEAAALMDDFPCLVIRGISDYADTHKNKAWQSYAAMTAAAYTKELLGVIPSTLTEVSHIPNLSDSKAEFELDGGLLTEAINSWNDPLPLKTLSLVACIVQLIDRIEYTLAFTDRGITGQSMWSQYRLKSATVYDLAAISNEVSLLKSCVQSRQKGFDSGRGAELSQGMNYAIGECTREASAFLNNCKRINSTEITSSHGQQELTELIKRYWQPHEGFRIRDCLKQCQLALWREIPLFLRRILCLGSRRISRIFSSHQTFDGHLSQLGLVPASAYNRAIATIINLQDGSYLVFKSDDLNEALRQIDANFQQKLIVYDQDSKRSQTDRQSDRNTCEALNATEALHPSFVKHQSPDIYAKIVDSLYFKVLSERQASISSPYASTFDWIFKDSRIERKPWSNFTEWLEEGNGCYWVCGKAGSGKSTLAKYLWQHPQLRSSLEHWANDDRLLMSSFFFWYAGSHLQRSQAGLVRSLLFRVLSSDHSLVLDILPELCFAIGASSSASSTSFENISRMTLEALKTGLQRVLSGAIPNTKIFLLIDGLDEYDLTSGEADEYEFPRTLLKASTTAKIKILICSRPVVACRSTFAKCPQLRLQDLNREDIAEVIRQDIRDNELFGDMEELFPEFKSQLMQSIGDRSEGVFLWVRLVIREIHRRVPNFDSPDELMRTLEELPTDLREFYEVTFRRVLPEHRQAAATMLRLVARSMEKQSLAPMSLLQLSFALDGDPHKSISMPVGKISSADEVRRYKIMDGRLQSRSLGLLEVQGKDFPRVIFLHRTVSEFLKTGPIEEELNKLSGKLDSDLDEILLGSCLATLKVKPFNRDELFGCLVDCLSYINALEEKLRFSQKAFWDAINSFVLRDHMNLTIQSSEPVTDHKTSITRIARMLGFRGSNDLCPDRNFVLLLFGGLPYTMNMVLQSTPIGVTESTYYLFHWVLFLYWTWSLESSLTPHIVLKNLDVLLQNGADAGRRLLPDHDKFLVLEDALDTSQVNDDGVSTWDWLARVLCDAHKYPIDQADFRFKMPTILRVLLSLLSQIFPTTQEQAHARNLRQNFLPWVIHNLPQELAILNQLDAALFAVELQEELRELKVRLAAAQLREKRKKLKVEKEMGLHDIGSWKFWKRHEANDIEATTHVGSQNLENQSKRSHGNLKSSLENSGRVLGKSISDKDELSITELCQAIEALDAGSLIAERRGGLRVRKAEPCLEVETIQKEEVSTYRLLRGVIPSVFTFPREPLYHIIVGLLLGLMIRSLMNR